MDIGKPIVTIMMRMMSSSIELGFNAKKRCFCGKPVVDGSEYCKEHKDMEERQCQR